MNKFCRPLTLLSYITVLTTHSSIFYDPSSVGEHLRLGEMESITQGSNNQQAEKLGIYTWAFWF